ncbi:MAG: iron-sulfur cluster assembly accessory protein, partial [Thiohalobacterales bacterium]|nr:iron-sulfur cluster assembly accessory protein [Thiohalobacterales bacterium]
MAIQLTERAAEHVRRMLVSHAGSIGLRLGTRKSGCSGFAYLVDYVDAVGEDDTVFETGGVKVVIDSASLPHLDGMTVDYVKNGLLSQELKFINPNVQS